MKFSWLKDHAMSEADFLQSTKEEQVKRSFMRQPFCVQHGTFTWVCATDGKHLVGVVLREGKEFKGENLPYELLSKLTSDRPRIEEDVIDWLTAANAGPVVAARTLLAWCPKSDKKCWPGFFAPTESICRFCGGLRSLRCECKNCGNKHVVTCDECETGKVTTAKTLVNRSLLKRALFPFDEEQDVVVGLGVQEDDQIRIDGKGWRVVLMPFAQVGLKYPVFKFPKKIEHRGVKR